MFDERIFEMIADSVETASRMCGYGLKNVNRERSESCKLVASNAETILSSWHEYPVIDGAICADGPSSFELMLSCNECDLYGGLYEYSLFLYIQSKDSGATWVRLLTLYNDGMYNDTTLNAHVILGESRYPYTSSIIKLVPTIASILATEVATRLKLDNTFDLNRIDYWVLEK